MPVQVNQGGCGPELVFPEDFNVASELIDRHILEGRSRKAAILSVDETVDYESLVQHVNRYGNALINMGLRPGDRALMVVRDAPEFYYMFWGSVKAGIIPVPLNTMLTSADYQFIIADSGARAIVYSKEFRDTVCDAASGASKVKHLLSARHEINSLHDIASSAFSELIPCSSTKDSECFWLYSSGTTGRPKGVIHTHQDIVATSELYSVQVLGGREQDRYYSIPKLFFAYGLGCGMTFPLYVGGTAILDARRPTPNIADEVISLFRPTIFAAVPTFFAAFLASGLASPEHLGELHRCISGGEALPEELQRRWLEVCPVPITDGIGSTEALHIYLSNSIHDIQPNSSGRVVPGYQARIIDETGSEIEDGRPGRLWIKGPSVTRKYWNNPEKTALSIVDGWLDTGDTYRRDEAGYYYYSGRNDDMLKVGGIWVSPFEIESTLISHPSVLEAAVVGCADDAGLIKPAAWVVLRDADLYSESTVKELRDFCKSHMAPYKYPRWIHCVESLPKTATGKIQRYKLRSMPAPVDSQGAVPSDAAGSLARI